MNTHILTIKSNHLKEGLQKTTRARQQNAIMPVYETIHCRTIKSGVVLTATNGDTTIVTGVRAEVKEVAKEFLIPMRAQTILMFLKDVDIEIHNGECLAFKYLDNVMKFPVEDPKKFPAIPKPEALVTFKVEDSIELRQLLQMQACFTSNDAGRPSMTGVRWTNKLLVATDCHQLILTKLKSGDDAFDIIVPKTFIQAFASIEQAVTVKVAKDFIVANDKDCKVISRIITEKFPDVLAVIPKASDLHIETDRFELLTNCKLAMNLSDKKTKRLTFTFKKSGYEMTAADSDLNQEMKMKGACSFKKNDANVTELVIGFNGALLTQQLECLTGESVKLEMDKPSRCALCHDEDTTFLIMPLIPPEK